MKDYRFTIPYDVRVNDVNYGGHVANSAVLNFFQDARIAFLRHLGDYGELDIGEGLGLILPEAQVRYHAEMFLGDVLEIGVRVEEMRNSSLVFGYRIERDGAATAEGTTAMVAFDYDAGRARRLPAAFREAIERLEEGQG